MTAYYNEFDPFAAEWLRNLIAAGHIADGDVDTRSIEDVLPSDIKGYTQCHFFAGIGGWSYALRLAGWPDDRPIWTGSCPCQPFSTAGKGAGTADERHLWPSFFHLIEQCRPNWVFGEQVASSDALAWLDLVCTDLEGTGYAARALDMCAAGFGAPHIRQRLYWVADNHEQQRHGFGHIGAGRRSESADRLEPRRMADGVSAGRPERRAESGIGQIAGSGGVSGMADGNNSRHAPVFGESDNGMVRGNNNERAFAGSESGFVSHELDDNRRPGPTNGAWRDADWLFCRDGRWRPVEPSTFCLAHGIPNRMGKLRGYGNAIVIPEAAEFIKSVIHEI